MGENDIYRIRPEHTHGGGLQICDDGSDGTVQKLGFFGVAPSVQRANANQAKLEDSAQLAQVIVLINELRIGLFRIHWELSGDWKFPFFENK